MDRELVGARKEGVVSGVSNLFASGSDDCTGNYPVMLWSEG